MENWPEMERIYFRKYHFNNDDMFSLLKNISEQQYVVQKAVTSSEIKMAIDEMWDKIIHSDNNLSSIVLPINICSNRSICCHFPQWVGLAITRNGNTYQAFYIDTLREYQCETDFNIELLKQILIKNGVNNINVNYLPSNQFYDCGPLTIIILDNIARRNSLLENIENIENLRERLRLSPEADCLSTNLLSKVEISRELIREIKETNPDKSKKRDIEIIVNTLKLLENTADIRNKFRQIGYLFGNITRDDSDKNNIRNQYGFSETQNNGIPFDQLCSFKEYLDHENEFQVLFEQQLEIFRSYLLILRKKLLNILKNEKEFVNDKQILDEIDLISEKNQDSSQFFIEEVGNYLKQQITFNIKKELGVLDDIDLENVEDRYVFARVFIVIGEWAKGLTNEQVISTKSLYNIRNKIIHCHKKIKHEKLDNDLIKSLIRDIEKNSNNEENKKKLLKHLKGRPTLPKQESQPRNNANVKYNLDFLIFEAAKIIQGISDHLNKEKKLMNLDKEYRSQLNLFVDTCKELYPGELHVKYSNEILEHSKHHLPLPSPERFLLKINQSEDRKIVNKNLYNCKIADINEECNYLIKVVNDKPIDKIKKHIISHSILIITQYVRDLSTMDYSNDIKNFQSCSNTAFPSQIRFLLDKNIQRIQNELLDEESSICYRYSLSHIQYCPIIALTFCNIGISMAKLTLYDKSIEYLEKASDYIAEFNKEIISSSKLIINENNRHEISNHLQLVVFRVDYYQLSIKHVFAKVLHLAKRVDDSFKEFDKINKLIQLDQIIEFLDINFQNELIKFYIDFSLLLIDENKFEYANEICNKALRLDNNNVAIEICLLKSYCRNGQFEMVESLLEKLLNTSQDNIEKFNIVNNVLIFCLTCLNIEGVSKAEHYLGKMKNLILDENSLSSFYDVYFQKYILSSLEILFVKTTINCCSESFSLEDLESKTEKLITLCKRKEHSIIFIIYLSFCWIHCDYAKRTSAQEHIDKAKSYYQLISEMKFSENLQNKNNEIYMEIIINFFQVYIDYNIDKSKEMDIEILKGNLNFGIDFQKKFLIQEPLILEGLIKLLYILAEKHIENYKNNTGNDNRFADLKQAILLFGNELTFYKYLENKSRSIPQLLKPIAFCFSELADNSFNIKFMKEAVFYYENILLHTLPVNEVMEYYKKKENYNEHIKAFKKLLMNLLNFNSDFPTNSIDQRIIDLCNEKFGLTLEVENQMLTLGNMNSIPEEILQKVRKEKEELENLNFPFE